MFRFSHRKPLEKFVNNSDKLQKRVLKNGNGITNIELSHARRKTCKFTRCTWEWELSGCSMQRVFIMDVVQTTFRFGLKNIATTLRHALLVLGSVNV